MEKAMEKGNGKRMKNKSILERKPKGNLGSNLELGDKLMLEFASDTRDDFWRAVSLEEAKAIVACGRKNRPVLWARVDRIMRDHLNLDYDQEMPSSLCFDKDGRNADGRHRLLAQIGAGVEMVRYLISTGLSEKTIQLLDRGKERSASERLIAFDESDVVDRISKGIASKKKYLSYALGFIYNVLTNEKDLAVGDDISLAIYFEKSASWAIGELSSDKIMRRNAILSAFMLAHHWTVTEGDKEHVEQLRELAHRIKTGELLTGNSLTLREYYLQLRKRSESTRRSSRAAHMAQGRAASTDSQWIVFHKSLRLLQAEITGETLSRLISPPKTTELREWFIGDHATMVKDLGLRTFRETRKIIGKEQRRQLRSRVLD
jgi:hypothetical protein